MTTRLLASFNALDNYSKDIKNKHARKNRLLGQLPVVYCTSSQKPETRSIDFDWDFALPGDIGTCTYETKSDIIKHELQNDKLRCFMLRSSKSLKATSREDPTRRPEHKARHGTVNIRPFSDPEDLAWEIDPLKGQESVAVKKNPTPSKTSKDSPRRQSWSREVEGIPPQGLGRNNSRALVGGALCYTNTSSWCTSPFPRDAPLTAFTEDDSEFSLPEPVRRVVCQQLQQGNVVHVRTSRPRRHRESSVNDVSDGDEATTESVPLCLADELERKAVKVLTPRATSVYAPLPTVSETYPVLCNNEFKHKPFNSSGFHSQNHPQLSASSRTVHSAIVCITESLQAKALDKKRKEREEEERLSIGALREVSQTHGMNLRVLSADASVAKDTEPGRSPLRGNRLASFPATPLPTGRSLHEPLEAPGVPLTSPLTMIHPTRRRDSSRAVGPVLNGMNSNQAETSVNPRESFRPLISGTRRKLITPAHKSTQRMPGNSQGNKKDFLLISKPLQRNTKDRTLFDSTKRLPNRHWHGPPSASLRGLPLLCYPTCHNEPPPSLNGTGQESQSYSVASGDGKDSSPTAKADFDSGHAINIPTAETIGGEMSSC